MQGVLASLQRNTSEVVQFRALVQALTIRHLAIRYRGSVLGFFWTLLNPMFLMLVYTLVFRYYIRFAQVEHYSLYLFCGLLPWIWMSSALSESASSIVGSGHLVTKSAFPAHVLPTVSVCTNLINFVLSVPVMLVFFLIAGRGMSWAMLLFPLVLLFHYFFIHGLCLIVSALNVLFRDVQHLVVNFLSFLFFLCPIIYPVSSVPEQYQFTLTMNPFSQYIIAYQQILFYGEVPSVGSLLLLALWALLALICGNYVFNLHRETFAELL